MILTSTSHDFLRAQFGDEISASYGKCMTLRAVHKTIAGRDIDTIINGLPAQPADEKPTTYSK